MPIMASSRLAADAPKIRANWPMINAPQLEIGEITQIGADVESMKYASFAREIRC